MLEAFPPLAGGNPRVLILGTFPSPLSREFGQYYGNPKNQFWRIMFDIFDKPFESPSYKEKKNLLIENNIALWDTLISCEVEGALDSNIRNPVYNVSIPEFVARHNVSSVIFNGGNAYTFYKRGIGKIDRNVLPSTSPANARMSYQDKLDTWRNGILKALG